MLVGRLDALLVSHPAAAVPAARHEQQEYVDLVQTLLRATARGLRRLEPQQLPKLLASAARLPLVTVSKAWCVRVITRVFKIMPEFTPTGLAILAWALGKLGMKFRADFAAKFLEEFKSKLHEASPRALAVVVCGLAGAGVRPDGLWMGIYLARVESVLWRFEGQNLSMLLWGLVQLR
eukprot:gene12317-12453_t